jgi:two-component system chemotaxis response regulator CheY
MAYSEHGFLTVLIADDDPAMRDLLAQLVVAEGHLPIPVDSAEAGLAALPLHTFDVALLDHHLPGMEGLVFGEYLTRNNPRMTVALVSGASDPRLPAQATTAGVTFIAKPFDPDRIAELLAAAVAREDALARTKAPAPEDAPGPVAIAHHWPDLAAAFGLSGCPQRLAAALSQRTREALEAIAFRGGFDERARAIAYAGLIAMQVLGLDTPTTRAGQPFTAWYDALMLESGRDPAFGGAPR